MMSRHSRGRARIAPAVLVLCLRRGVMALSLLQARGDGPNVGCQNLGAVPPRSKSLCNPSLLRAAPVNHWTTRVSWGYKVQRR